jgi:hypothetical protein
MDTQFDIEKILAQGKITSELELERAMIADRKLRSLASNEPEFKSLRKKLRDLIEEYESKNWSASSDVSKKQLESSDFAESTAEEERVFLKNRKEAIKKKLNELMLTQQEFGEILGHSNKSYISELMNGIRPFSMHDLVVIHNLLDIPLKKLIPTSLGVQDLEKLEKSIKKVGTGRIKLSKGGLVTK